MHHYRMLPRFALLAISAFLPLSAVAAVSFDSILSTDNLWNLTPAEFQKATRGMPFAWSLVVKAGIILMAVWMQRPRVA